jgi:putative endonuclease
MSTVARPVGPAHLGLGRKGEQLAAQHLQKLGFVLLSKNWRCREGELDLVGTDGRTLVVCEVKTRSGVNFGDPAEAVTADKIARIRRITSQWLRTFSVSWCPVRFDVIAVYASPDGRLELRHIPGAF